MPFHWYFSWAYAAFWAAIAHAEGAKEDCFSSPSRCFYPKLLLEVVLGSKQTFAAEGKKEQEHYQIHFKSCNSNWFDKSFCLSFLFLARNLLFLVCIKLKSKQYSRFFGIKKLYKLTQNDICKPIAQILAKQSILAPGDTHTSLLSLSHVTSSTVLSTLFWYPVARIVSKRRLPDQRDSTHYSNAS